ncbi:hypothetical protein [Marinifilum flexuosum]|uniref:hypothetical protein n=1 Tax=Marinifilum flexuosum TaxID=1117708 RepID=UPI0024951F57|nr:hypothetical protein [Marinifilum flexuosum]
MKTKNKPHYRRNKHTTQNNIPNCDDTIQNPLTQGGGHYHSLPLGYMIFALQANPPNNNPFNQEPSPIYHNLDSNQFGMSNAGGVPISENDD